MKVIHFTTDPLMGFDASGARFLPLVDGTGDTHISCLHLEQGASIAAPSISHAATLLVVGEDHCQHLRPRGHRQNSSAPGA
jgi:hypothetical protein